jgi:glycosyltransferase involved in cell wall biosynthesis
MEIVPVGNETYVGSVPNNAVRLAKELNSRGHDILVVTSDVRHELQGLTAFEWGSIYPIHPNGGYASLTGGIQYTLKAIPLILKIHAKENIDVLHGHSAYPLLAPIDGLSSAFGSMPAVFSQYAPIKTMPLRDRKGIYQGLSSTFLSKYLFANIKRLTVFSDNTRESLVKIGIREDRIVNLPPAVDPSFFGESVSQEKVGPCLDIPEDAPKILYIGNWATWKGVDYLIESMTRVREVFPDARLITAWGEVYDWHDDRKEFIDRRIEELGLRDAIVQVGIVEDLPSLIRMCDVVAEPFLNTDGVADLPLAILESMACGKPVISTKVEGIPEIVNHGVNGLLVDPGNSEELANALIRILQNEDESGVMGRSARNFAFTNYSSKTVVDKLETIYHDVTDG